MQHVSHNCFFIFITPQTQIFSAKSVTTVKLLIVVIESVTTVNNFYMNFIYMECIIHNQLENEIIII